MKTSLAIALALLSAAPLLANDPPATQPSEKSPEKPKGRHNDEQPRRKVPLIAKEPKDLWKLLPEELRPGKDGKVSDELADKIDAWLKENGKNMDKELQFTSTDTTGRPEKDAFNCIWKEGSVLIATAPVTDPKEIAKTNSVKHDGYNQKKVPEVLGMVDEINLLKTAGSIRLSVKLKESKVVSVKLIKQ